MFNNVFDGGNRLDVPGIEVCPGGAVKSVRNNVFFNFAHKETYFKRPQAAIRMMWNDASAKEKPARLGYADYNLFYNPAAKTPRNHLLSVPGKTERKEAGFGLNDIPRGGKIDEQADPKFRGAGPQKISLLRRGHQGPEGRRLQDARVLSRGLLVAGRQPADRSRRSGRRPGFVHRSDRHRRELPRRLLRSARSEVKKAGRARCCNAAAAGVLRCPCAVQRGGPAYP